MSYIHFNFVGENPITAQPAGGTLVAVSSSPSDTTQTLYASGELSNNPVGDSMALNGTLEVQGTQAFDKINFLTLSDACAGQVTVQEAGVAANGHIFPISVPADATTMEIGLTGYTQTYTFVTPARHQVTCPDGGNLNVSGTGSYIEIGTDSGTRIFWFDNGVTTAPGGIDVFAVPFSGEKAVYSLEFLSGALITQSSYFSINGSEFWFNVDSGGTIPSPGAIEVSISSSGSANDVATAVFNVFGVFAPYTTYEVVGSSLVVTNQGVSYSPSTFTDYSSGTVFTQVNPGVNGSSASANAAALQASIAANAPSVVSSVVGDTVTITNIKLGVYTITQNASQFTITIVSPGTVLAANQIRTGFSDAGTALTNADVAQYITYAINHAAPGTNVIVSSTTPENEFLTATYVSGTVSVVDKVQCIRSLAWVFTASNSSLTMIAPAGGANGNVISVFSFGTTNAFDVLILNAEDLSYTTMPPQFTGTSTPYILNGNFATIYLKCDPVPAGQVLSVYYQTSNDGINWSNGKAAIPNLDDNTVLDPIIQYCEEGVLNQIRLIVADNTLDAPVSVCAGLAF